MIGAPALVGGPIDFLDLGDLHATMRPELDRVWADTLARSSFIGGSPVAAFEQAWAAYCGVEHCIGVANGTDALELVLTNLGLTSGDEVIMAANTFVATAEAVVTAGATPVFVDVADDTLLVEATAIEAAITARTRAVIVVHLFGQIPVMEPIVDLCEAHDLALVEDAAQAHGARHLGRPAGGFGRAATFSFYPGKNLGALGDGGAVVTDDAELAEAIRTASNHGRPGNHHRHVVSGRNSRLDGLQAAVLSAKLGYLDAWNAARRAAHGQYRERLDSPEIQLLECPPGTRPVHHLEVIRVADRDRVRAALGDVGIASGVHYALPCHLQPAFAAFAPDAALINAETAANRQLSLPTHPLITDEAIRRVADTVLAAVGAR